MRQYLKQNKEILTLAFALLIAMIIQYFRIVSLDIAFLFETEAPTFTIYFIGFISISVLVMFFVFIPLAVITEITYSITLPIQLNIEVKEVVYKIKSTTSNIINKPKRTIVLRC